MYTGTIGPAVEALSNGILAIAYPGEANGIHDVVDTYLEAVTQELLPQKLSANALWNVNFPGCSLNEYRGILKDRIPSQHQFYLDNYVKTDKENGDFVLEVRGIPVTEAEEGTDIRAVLDRYISIGVVRNAVL